MKAPIQEEVGELIEITLTGPYYNPNYFNIKIKLPNIMNAKQARALALKTKVTAQDAEINSAITAIDAVAANGDMEMTFAGALSKVVVDHLKSVGFLVYTPTPSVANGLNVVSTTVNWEEENLSFLTKLVNLFLGR